MKFQTVLTLAEGDVIKSEVMDLNEEQKNAMVELLEYAVKGKLNIMQFVRDTGSRVFISEAALRTMRFAELVEVPDHTTPKGRNIE